jgi:hypothetical protein
MWIFFKKKGIQVFKKNLRGAEFYEKMGQKIIVVHFFLSFNSKLSHSDKRTSILSSI